MPEQASTLRQSPIRKFAGFVRAIAVTSSRASRFPGGLESDRRLSLEFDLEGVPWGRNADLKKDLVRRMEIVGGVVLLDELTFTGGPQTRRSMCELEGLGIVRRLWRPFWIKRDGYKLTHYGWQLAKMLHSEAKAVRDEAARASDYEDRDRRHDYLE